MNSFLPSIEAGERLLSKVSARVCNESIVLIANCKVQLLFSSNGNCRLSDLTLGALVLFQRAPDAAFNGYLGYSLRSGWCAKGGILVKSTAVGGKILRKRDLGEHS